MKHYLYIIGEAAPGCRTVKVGVTQSLAGRLSSLQTGHHSRLMVHRAYPFPDRESANRAERRFHIAHGDDCGMCGEWFGMPPERSAAFIEEFYQCASER